MVRRVATRLVLAVIALAVLGVGAALVVYPAEYVFRLLAWRDSDVGDVDRFSAQTLTASSRPYEFARAPDEERVRRAFAAAGGELDLDSSGSPGGGPPGLDPFLEGAGTQAFLVVEDGVVVYEGYFGGAGRDTVVTSFSVAKSFASTLVGIAAAEGSIASVDDPITAYLPELRERDVGFEHISVADLLRMSSGLRYEEFPFFHGDDAKTYYHPDLRELALEETSIQGRPGESFHYNNYHPLLLGLILERATGVPVTAYLQTRLWEPMGMEYDGSWSVDSETSGFPKMESGLNGRAVDFAKLGQLFLDGGLRRGEQLVPAAWVKAATTPAPHVGGYYPEGYSTGEWALGYGFMWWVLETERPDGSIQRDFMAWGKYGQIVFVSPENRVVVVRNGSEEGVSLGRWFRVLAGLAESLSGT